MKLADKSLFEEVLRMKRINNFNDNILFKKEIIYGKHRAAYSSKFFGKIT